MESRRRCDSRRLRQTGRAHGDSSPPRDCQTARENAILASQIATGISDMAGGEVEVVIVGGGAAGIAAARRLREAGVDALIVEARSRLGGRAWSLEAAGFPIDLGCGWLHSAERNPWTPIARGAGPRDRQDAAAVDAPVGPDRPSRRRRGRLRRGDVATFTAASTLIPRSSRTARPRRSSRRAIPGTISSTPSAPITAARSSNSSRCAISRATTTTA